jgi:hypothetical protein
MLLFLSWKPSPDLEGSKQSEASEEITPCDIFNRPVLESSHSWGKWGESNYRSLIWVPELNELAKQRGLGVALGARQSINRSDSISLRFIRPSPTNEAPCIEANAEEE